MQTWPTRGRDSVFSSQLGVFLPALSTCPPSTLQHRGLHFPQLKDVTDVSHLNRREFVGQYSGQIRMKQD